LSCSDEVFAGFAEKADGLPQLNQLEVKRALQVCGAASYELLTKKPHNSLRLTNI
jgi:hypothetical protein